MSANIVKKTSQVDVISAMAAIISASAGSDGSNALLEALAQASGYTVVKNSGAKTIKHKHDRCTSLSPYKMNGQKKATAAEPIRSQEEFQAMAEYILTHGNVRNRQRNYTIFICGITMGLRVGDLLRLTIGDVYDFSSGTTFSHVTVINEKTHKRTSDMITPLASRAICDLVDQIREAQGGVLDPSWPLFQSQKWCRAGGTTEKLSKSQVYRMLTKAAADCGIQEHISTHSMRKTYVAEQISKSGHITKSIVSALPSTSEAKENVIYMVEKVEADENNSYDEYMLINGKLELIGNTKTVIDPIPNGEIDELLNA